MSQPTTPTTFGDTLSSGIQDVAALLPLLGTEQCEKHVGTALEKGYLYAAATSLSIFGSLGIVKAAFSTLLATTTRPFYGGSWLNDAGFGTKGSVSSMVTLVEGTKRYGAEVQLQRLMKEQHIDDPEMVADIEWYGWQKKVVDGMTTFSRPALSWNVALILTSMITSVVSISPYLYLIHNSRGRAILWLFPLLRSIGSLLCVVSVQLALQIRIHRITTTSLLLMKARKRFPLSTDEATKDRDTLLESRLRNLRVELGRLPDQERQPSGHQSDIQDEAESHGLSQGILLFLLQAILVVGMGMIVAGYVGCFNIVGRTDVKGGPYVWFGMEAILATLRIVLWGWNPSWDEGSTGMTMQLALRNTDLTPDVTTPTSPDNPVRTAPQPLNLPEGSDPNTSDPPIKPLPLITTPRFLAQFTETSRTSWEWQWHEASLIAENVEDFLAANTPYVGPLQRLESDKLKGISLYCGIVPDGGRKLLCTTACRDDSRWTSISVLIDGNTPPYAMYISRSRDLPGTRALQVTLQKEVQAGSATIIDRLTLDLLIDYSSHLFSRLCMLDNSVNQLPLSWNVTLPSLPNSEDMHRSILLTEQDKAYIQIHQIHDLKGNYCLLRNNLIVGVFSLNRTVKWHGEMNEWALLFESAVMEVYLCILERQFVQSMSLSPAHSRRIQLEWIQNMEDRIEMEKEACRWRRRDADPTTIFQYQMTHDLLAQGLRSLRQLPVGSGVLEDWKALITTIMDQPDKLPPISTLFGLPPLQGLKRLKGLFFPLFVVTDGSNNSLSDVPPSMMYRNIIDFLRSSLHRLRDTKASSLHDRIDPWGPGSPEFSPPYTCVHESSERILEALVEQIESVQMIEFRTDFQDMLLDALRLFESLPPSRSLTTMKFNCESFTNEATLLVTSVLQRHPGIICVGFKDCVFDHRLGALIDENITLNRQKWKDEARNGGVFTYSIGCEIRPGDYDNSDPFRVHYHDILLSNFADLFAMIYLPQGGRVVPNVSLQAQSVDIILVAFLTPADNDGNDAHSNDTHTTQCDIAASFKFALTPITGFPEVKAGCYELRIRLAHKAQYLFKRLTIDFIAGSNSAEEGLGADK
ncbi:hypothetical protein PQX77_005982 [Marasmius sp. AFHP31]|nr:hypothetical protein PQX77_005982 [Marasmius sp. AFHP31]